MVLVERTLLVQLNPALQAQSPGGPVFDLASVDAMDGYITRCIRDLAIGARLMGVPTIVCGVQPQVADTPVEMGLTLGAVLSARKLDAALRLLRGSPAARACLTTGWERSWCPRISRREMSSTP